MSVYNPHDLDIPEGSHLESLIRYLSDSRESFVLRVEYDPKEGPAKHDDHAYIVELKPSEQLPVLEDPDTGERFGRSVHGEGLSDDEHDAYMVKMRRCKLRFVIGRYVGRDVYFHSYGQLIESHMRP